MPNPDSEKTFTGAQLELAREFKGWTQAQLAREIGVSHVFVSQLEAGKKRPTDILVEACSGVLGFEPSFFSHAIDDVFTEEECNFRHRRSSPERLKRRFRAYGTLMGALMKFLTESVRLPAYDVPALTAASVDEIERAAEQCREHWGLTTDRPAPPMTRVLENAGVVVLRPTIPEAGKIDAFSRAGESNIVFLNEAKGGPSRWVFDLAHELGHLVLHRGRSTGCIETEAEANRFAGAFLLPRRQFGRAFRAKALDWDHIWALKKTWSVSAAAILYRAKQLDVIDAAQYLRLVKTISARGWHSSEPFEPTFVSPVLLTKAVKAARAQLKLSPVGLCLALAMKPQTFEELTGLSVVTSSNILRMGEGGA